MYLHIPKNKRYHTRPYFSKDTALFECCQDDGIVWSSNYIHLTLTHYVHLLAHLSLHTRYTEITHPSKSRHFFIYWYQIWLIIFFVGAFWFQNRYQHIYFFAISKNMTLWIRLNTFFSINLRRGEWFMTYCKLLTITVARWQKNSVIQYLIFTSSKIHTYIMKDLSADIVPWQVQDRLQF